MGLKSEEVSDIFSFKRKYTIFYLISVIVLFIVFIFLINYKSDYINNLYNLLSKFKNNSSEDIFFMTPNKLLNFLFAVIGFVITILSIFGVGITSATQTLTKTGFITEFIIDIVDVVIMSLLNIILLILIMFINTQLFTFFLFMLFIITFTFFLVKLLKLVIVTLLMFAINLLALDQTKDEQRYKSYEEDLMISIKKDTKEIIDKLD